MNLYDVECKLMEARKYSHEYYDVESKFRHRNARSLQRHQIWNNLCPVNTFICYMCILRLTIWNWSSIGAFDSDIIGHRNLQLITAYAVQNPFLLGCFMLRKEQLSLQLPQKASTILHLLQSLLNPPEQDVDFVK